MKTFVYIILNLFVFFGILPVLQAQEIDNPQQSFLDNSWYLTKLIVEGEEYAFVPDASLAEVILELQEYESDQDQFSGFMESAFCESGGTFFEINQEDLYTMDWTILAGLSINEEYENCSWNISEDEGNRVDNQLYFEVFWDYEGSDYPFHFTYNIEQNENHQSLIVINDAGYEAHYQSVPYMSVDKNDLSNLNIYPNPVKESFQIENLTEQSNLKIYDISGKEIFEQEIHSSTESVDVSQLSSGLYFYGIFQEGRRVKTGKLVKE